MIARCYESRARAIRLDTVGFAVSCRALLCVAGNYRNHVRD
jgi:hypothetical protein